MAKLPETTGYQKRYRYARKVVRRVRRLGHETLAKNLETVASLVKTVGREEEDAAEPVDDALTDRDLADAALDDVAKRARLDLASRSVAAAREEPYVSIFHSGIDYYISAPINEETKRYGELRDRLVEYLPETDPVRQEAVPKVEDGITAYRQAAKAVDDANTAYSLVSTRLASAEQALDRQLEKTYGALIESVGKAKADRCFPSVRKPKPKKAAPAKATAPELAPPAPQALA
ncbi:MAG: hypothetical protein AMXMBFR64_17780 [Myxococcales bacterium]